MRFKLPKFFRLPQINIAPIKKIVSYLVKYKILTIILISLTTLIAVALWYRGYLLSKMKHTPEDASDGIFYSAPTDKPSPTLDTPTPSPSTKNVLGASDNSGYNNSENSYTPPTLATPFPTIPPLPTIIPEPIITSAPYTPPTTNYNSGDSNCTTGAGVPNSWYSDVYPNPPISTNTGSETLLVYIRDCNKNTASVTDTLKISLSSGDSNTQVDGHNLPYSIKTQNGQASFAVTSRLTGTVTLTVQDTTSSFTVTDINNHNPSIIFNVSSATTPTPTIVNTPTPSLTNIPTPTPAQSNTPTPTPSSTSTPTPTPGS